MCFAYLASVCDTTVLKLPKRERQSFQTTMLDISGSFFQPQHSDFLQGNLPSSSNLPRARVGARSINSDISEVCYQWLCLVLESSSDLSRGTPPQRFPASLPREPESCLKAHTCDLFKGSRYLNGKLWEMFL